VTGRARGFGARIAALAVAAVFAAPFAYLVVRGLADLGGALDAALGRRALAALGRSILLGAAVSASAAALGTASAWLVVRTDVPWRRAWRVLLPVPLVIPSFIGAFALIAAFAPGGLVERLVGARPARVDGFWGAYVVLVLLTYPFVYLPVAARLAQLPRSLEESARLLGRGQAATFARVVAPQLRGSVLAGTLLVFLYVVSDFGVVQLMRYDTLTRTIYATRLLDRDTSLALSLELGLLALAVVILERRLAPRGREEETRGERPLLAPLGRWRAAATGGLAALVGLAVVAPVAVLAYWALRGVLRGTERTGALVSDAGTLAEPALNTVGVALAAGAVALVSVLPVAYASRRRGVAGEAASAIVVAGFALPGLAIALALVFWTVDAPAPVGTLYGTLPLLVLAYVVHFGAQTLRTAQVAVGGVPGRLDEAARGLGASRTRRFLRVELPLMGPALLAGAGMVVLSTMKELPATLLLAPPGFQTLATKIWGAAEDAFLADAALGSLVLIALSALLTAFVLRGAGAVRVRSAE
jgi:iron(III) transport system permease protein